MDPGIKLHMEMMRITALTFIIPVIVNYNIPEKLIESPKTTEELSSGTEIIPEHLYRYLSVLETIEIFKLDPSSGKWSNTPKSLLLTSDLCRFTWLWQGSKYSLEHFLHVETCLTSNKPSHEFLERPSFFEELGRLPDTLANFQNFLKELTKVTSDGVTSVIDLNSSSKVLKLFYWKGCIWK